MAMWNPSLGEFNDKVPLIRGQPVELLYKLFCVTVVIPSSGRALVSGVQPYNECPEDGIGGTPKAV